MHTTDDDMQSDQMDSLEVDPLSTTSDSLRLRTDVLGTGIEKKKDEAEEEKEEEEEHPDLLDCRPCGLVFARAWGLKDHQIRGCSVDEPPPRDAREKTMEYRRHLRLRTRMLP